MIAIFQTTPFALAVVFVTIVFILMVGLVRNERQRRK